MSTEPTQAAAPGATTPRRVPLRIALALVTLVCAGLYLRGLFASRDGAELELASIGFATERALVTSRWSMNGEVKSAGFGVAQLDFRRELHFALEEATVAGASTSWRAHLFGLFERPSLLLGTESLAIAPSGWSAPRKARELGALWEVVRTLIAEAVEVRRAAQGLNYLCEGGCHVARESELPRALSPVARGPRELERYRMPLLAFPERLKQGAEGPQQSARWSFPEAGGTLLLDWRARIARFEAGQSARITADVGARWWREARDPSEPPTRSGSGTATWEVDLQRAELTRFELVVDWSFDADPGADPGVRCILRTSCELEWRTLDWRGWCARRVVNMARILARGFLPW